MAPWLRSRLRQAIGWIAVYAMVLQATLAGALLHPTASTDPAQAFDPLAVICLIDGGKAHAGLPDEQPGGSGHTGALGNHCGLCAVSVPALAALVASVIDQLTPARSYGLPPAADQVATPSPTPFPGRPRAPPAIA